MRPVTLTLLLSLCPALASAQAADVVVVGLGGDAPAAASAQARDAVARALAQDGLRVLPPSDLAMRVSPARLRACQSAECAFDLGGEVGVSMVAAVTTWATDGAVTSLTVSLIVGRDRAHTATAEVGEAGLDAAARHAVTEAQESRRRALIVEGTQAPVHTAATPEVAQVDDPHADDSLHRDRPLEEWILPSILAAVGLALTGAAVYAMLDEQCERVGGSGVCLRGSRPNYGLGATFSVLGVLSIAGAIIWLVVGGQPASTGDIDVVFDARGAGVRF